MIAGYVLSRNVSEQRRALLAWAAGLAVLATIYMALYPAIRSSGVNIQQLLDKLPEAVRNAILGAGVDYNTPTGYLGTELFAFIVPVILLVMSITNGSRALAAEESTGTIDVLLSTPLRRRRLVGEKWLSAVLPTLAVAAVVWIVVAGLGPAFGVGVSLGSLAIGLLAVALMAIAFGTLALAIAGATGKRGVGAGVAGALAVALYALNAVAPSVGGLQPVAEVLSPFHWAGGPGVLAHGVQWPGMLALVALPFVFVVLGVLAYDGRDIAA